MLCVPCRRPGFRPGRQECCVFSAGDLVSGPVGTDLVCSLPATWFRVL